MLTISPIFLPCMRYYTHQCILLHSITMSVPPVVEILTIPHQFMSGSIHAPSTNSEETLSACQPVGDSAPQSYLDVFFLVPWDSHLWQRKQDWVASLWWGWDGLAQLAPGKAGHFHGSIDQLLDIGFLGEGVWLLMKWLSLDEVQQMCCWTFPQGVKDVTLELGQKFRARDINSEITRKEAKNRAVKEFAKGEQRWWRWNFVWLLRLCKICLKNCLAILHI